MQKVIRIKVEIIDWENGIIIKESDTFFFSARTKWYAHIDNLLALRKLIKRLIKNDLHE